MNSLVELPFALGICLTSSVIEFFLDFCSLAIGQLNNKLSFFSRRGRLEWGTVEVDWLGFCESWEHIKFVYSHWSNFKSTFRDLRQDALCDDEIKPRNRMKQNVLVIWDGLMRNPLPVTRRRKLVKEKKPLVVHKIYTPLGQSPRKRIVWTCQTDLSRFNMGY